MLRCKGYAKEETVIWKDIGACTVDGEIFRQGETTDELIPLIHDKKEDF